MDAPFGRPIMESSKPEIERVVLILGMGIVILAMLCHFFSPIARTLDKQLDIQITVLADPPALIRYHPSSLTADIVQLPENTRRRQGMPGLEKISGWYIIPPPGDVWPSIKEWIRNWRTNPWLVFKYAAFLWKLHSKELTNISLYDLILLALEVPLLDVSDFYIVTAPQSAWSTNAPPGAEGTETRSKVTAEVLNAAGRRHLAHKVRKFLISNGVDVVYFGNYKQLQANTMIIDRSGRISACEEVRSLLGLESIEIHSKPDKTRLADVTVIVGKDFSLPQN